MGEGESDVGRDKGDKGRFVCKLDNLRASIQWCFLQWLGIRYLVIEGEREREKEKIEREKRDCE